MDKGLSSQAFARLLDRLGDDPDQAGERYEDLRRVLSRFFEWRGASFSDELADETLNRLARKLDEGLEIKNVDAYCHEVGRLVFLESLRSRDARGVSLDGGDLEIVATDASQEIIEKERRMRCLDQCLEALTPENRALITGYYQDDRRARIDHRQALAASLGLRRDALANRAQRLRDKLERCVRRCCMRNH